jgi:threonine synthase
MDNFFSHLQCSQCAAIFDRNKLQTVCPSCGKALLARYDLATARSCLSREIVARRRGPLWKYRELLPVLDPNNIVSLGEGNTPVVQLHKLGQSLNIARLWMKDEGMNPTGSFKARGMTVAISKAKEFGVRDVTAPSAGNAGGALAAYAARAGIRAHVFMPKDTPRANIDEALAFGAETVLVDGTIADAARAMSDANNDLRWFDCSTLKEPYRLEGKKTLGFEIAEQFDYDLPDVVMYPTGGGTGLIGMWKAFDELEQLGWLSSKRPRMVAVQPSGCAPIVQAFEQRNSVSTFWEHPITIASGLRVPKAFADYLILKVVYESNGLAVAVDDREIISEMKTVAREEGLFLCPEGAATVCAARKLARQGRITAGEKVLLLNTATGYKYPDLYEVK